MWRTVYGACNYRQSPATRPLRGESLATSPDWPPGTTPLILVVGGVSLCQLSGVSGEFITNATASLCNGAPSHSKPYHCVNNISSSRE